MIYPKLILLYFIYKIGSFREVKAASLVIGASPELETENFLTAFMTDLKISSIEKLNYHWLAVIGTSENFLQSTKGLLESNSPHFVITKLEISIDPFRFGPNSIVLFFIDGSSHFQINSAVSKLPTDFGCRVLLISMKEKTTDQTISEILNSAAKMKINNVSFAKFDGQAMKIYRRVLDVSCEKKITLFDTWIPKKGFANSKAIIGHIPQPNGHGCPMFVSTFAALPTMILGKNDNGTLEIRGGVEGHLVTAVAKYLRMVPVLKVPSIEEHFLIFSNGTAAGIVGDVAGELAMFGIGQIRPTMARSKLVDVTMIYGYECMVWTVPLNIEYDNSIIVSEFSPITWIIIILLVILCSGLNHAASKFHGVLPTPALEAFDIIAMTLNYAVPRRPTGLVCRLLFLVYVHYSRIISTAYSASLSSLLTAPTVKPTIQDEGGIIASGLRTAGTEGSRHLLLDQISPNSTRAELIERFEVISSPDEALLRIVDRQDIAYLRHRSTINYAAQRLAIAGKPIEFYAIPDCVISYNSVMVTQKGSDLTIDVDKFMLRLREAGIDQIQKYVDHCSSTFQFLPLKYKDRALPRLRSVFLLYLYCLIPAFLVFGAELVASKLKFNPRFSARWKN